MTDAAAEEPCEVSLSNVDIRFCEGVSKSDVFDCNRDDKIWDYLHFFDALAGLTRRRGAGAAPPPETIQFQSSVGLGRVGLGGMFIGAVLGAHVTLAACVLLWDREGNGRWASLLLRWCGYAVSLAVFHGMEFISTARFKARATTFDSYLLNHSAAYQIACLVGWTEFWLGFFWGPRAASETGDAFSKWTLWPGALLVFGGLLLRVCAMWTAGRHFSHLIVVHRSEGHHLVQHGVYRYLRHPAYCGWFWWSVGTQLLLSNPVCAVAYTVAAWRFFHGRIPVEEELLCNMFAGEYEAYRQRTWVGIPFLETK